MILIAPAVNIRFTLKNYLLCRTAFQQWLKATINSLQRLPRDIIPVSCIRYRAFLSPLSCFPVFLCPVFLSPVFLFTKPKAFKCSLLTVHRYPVFLIPAEIPLTVERSRVRIRSSFFSVLLRYSRINLSWMKLIGSR